jgi:hypothetical protein
MTDSSLQPGNAALVDGWVGVVQIYGSGVDGLLVLFGCWASVELWCRSLFKLWSGWLYIDYWHFSRDRLTSVAYGLVVAFQSVPMSRYQRRPLDNVRSSHVLDSRVLPPPTLGSSPIPFVILKTWTKKLRRKKNSQFDCRHLLINLCLGNSWSNFYQIVQMDQCVRPCVARNNRPTVYHLLEWEHPIQKKMQRPAMHLF